MTMEYISHFCIATMNIEMVCSNVISMGLIPDFTDLGKEMIIYCIV